MDFLTYMAVVFCVWASFMIAIHIAFHKQAPAWMDRRRPRPPIALAIDVLSSPTGWSQVPYARDMTHVSGLLIGVKYDQTVERMEVNGQAIPLRQCEKRALTNAIKRTTERRDALKSEEALKAWADNVQKYVDNVVSIKRKAS